jgi:hypothetical protein
MEEFSSWNSWTSMNGRCILNPSELAGDELPGCLAVAISTRAVFPCKTAAAVEENDRMRDEALQYDRSDGESLVFRQPKANGWF